MGQAGMKAATVGLFAAAALAGCAQTGATDQAPQAPATAGGDSCARSEWTPYVGRARTELPTPSASRRVRIHSTTDAVTMDFREDRVNVVWDAGTGRVVEVRCG